MSRRRKRDQQKASEGQQAPQKAEELLDELEADPALEAQAQAEDQGKGGEDEPGANAQAPPAVAVYEGAMTKCPHCGRRRLMDRLTQACEVVKTYPEQRTETCIQRDRKMLCRACRGQFTARERLEEGARPE